MQCDKTYLPRGARLLIGTLTALLAGLGSASHWQARTASIRVRRSLLQPPGNSLLLAPTQTLQPPNLGAMALCQTTSR